MFYICIRTFFSDVHLLFFSVCLLIMQIFIQFINYYDELEKALSEHSRLQDWSYILEGGRGRG
jgi:hypothetical protein